MVVKCTCLATAALVVVASAAHAQQTSPPGVASEPVDRESDGRPPRPGLLDRPHTVAEFEAGVIALPTAPISRAREGGDTPLGRVFKGDATVLTGLHLLYRGSPEWALGAGFLFAPSPTSDSEYGGRTDLPRTHSRSYLMVGAEGRYFPFRYRLAEAWVGLASSAVIVADRYAWESAPTLPAILGSRSVTIQTEGFALAIQAGGNWMFAERWVAGLTLRASRWILPQEPSCSPVGDCATLKGTVEAFEAGLTLGYRIPL
jgi:hypothetical protein